MIDDMIPIESIIKEYISNVFTAHTKENPRTVETIEEESPGRILDHNDLGLGGFDDTPLNDDFGAGLGAGMIAVSVAGLIDPYLAKAGITGYDDYMGDVLMGETGGDVLMGAVDFAAANNDFTGEGAGEMDY